MNGFDAVGCTDIARTILVDHSTKPLMLRSTHPESTEQCFAPHNKKKVMQTSLYLTVSMCTSSRK
jgi:hypothetical protein